MRSLVLAVVLLVGFSFGSTVLANSGPVEVRFEATPGDVTYTHAAHTRFGAKCQSCHHNGVLSGTCHRCHDGKQAPHFKVAAHKVCKECHQKKGGPVNCKGCHLR